MPPQCPHILGTLTPFLYPFLVCNSQNTARRSLRFLVRRHQHTQSIHESSHDEEQQFNRLNPPPDDYSRPVFADRATITIGSGGGGHGCISFLREKYVEKGPANGGSGGSGGNIYIQAVRGETSLHKLARRGTILAGRGKNGQGKTRGGDRGEDIIVQVPIGTVVREISRYDPVAIEEEKKMTELGKSEEEADVNITRRDGPHKWDREKWLLYPAITPEDIASAEFPTFPRARRSALAMSQVPAPISLDLSSHMETPLLLAAGAVGGLGNPHFVTKEVPRPKFATKGGAGMTIELELELKLLADVGLVGLPNAGKSTLLRALTNSRARIGNWAFTTLQPNIGTVVLDNHVGRPIVSSKTEDGKSIRTNFTIADIPGLIPDAHLDRGLGISFLRHVERARLLAFVVDLGAGDAVEALKGLWKEVSLYEEMKTQEDLEKSEQLVEWKPFQTVDDALNNRSETIIVSSSNGTNPYGNPFPNKPELPSIASKPWFVVATKADLPDTQENFQNLKTYLEGVETGEVEHPSGKADGWRRRVLGVPVSGINGHGVKKITEWSVELLDQDL